MDGVPYFKELKLNSDSCLTRSTLFIGITSWENAQGDRVELQFVIMELEFGLIYLSYKTSLVPTGTRLWLIRNRLH